MKRENFFRLPRLSALVVLLCIAPASARAADEAPPVITVERAVELAIKNNLSLEAESVSLDTKKRKSDLVWNQFLPDLTVQGTVNNNPYAEQSSALVPDPTSVALPGMSIYDRVMLYSYDEPKWLFNANVQASLAISFALIHGIRSIHLDYQAGLVTMQKVRIQTERDVRKLYCQMLALEQTVALQRESLEMAERRYRMAEANYRAGLAPRLNMLQAQVAVETAKPSLREMENNFALLKSRFAMMLGMPFDSAFNLSPLPDADMTINLDLADLIKKAAQGSIEILELKAKILTLETQKKAQALQLYTPALVFAWNMSPTFVLEPKGDEWIDSGSFSITLRLGVNGLFPFTKEGQGLKDTANGVRSMSIGLTQLIQGTEVSIYNTVLALGKTQESAEAQRQTVELAETAYRLSEDAYRAGLQDFLQVRDAALQLSQAKLQLLSSQFEYMQGLIDLEYSIGVPFGTLSGKQEVGSGE
ncbi:MAG: TolC family protein [Treponema sp.]|jgi:outer membrane protein TolC|nr:TolC family protein [Treponema sp.]